MRSDTVPLPVSAGPADDVAVRPDSLPSAPPTPAALGLWDNEEPPF